MTSSKSSFWLLALLIFTMSVLTSCDEISHGQQRRKFEFLYKMSNLATVFREYTFDVIYFKDLDLYEVRMNKLRNDVSNSQSVPGWEKSDHIKDEFLRLINENLELTTKLRMRQAVLLEFIKDEHEVVSMQDNTRDFLESVNETIVEVGRE